MLSICKHFSSSVSSKWNCLLCNICHDKLAAGRLFFFSRSKTLLTICSGNLLLEVCCPKFWKPLLPSLFQLHVVFKCPDSADNQCTLWSTCAAGLPVCYFQRHMPLPVLHFSDKLYWHRPQRIPCLSFRLWLSASCLSVAWILTCHRTIVHWLAQILFHHQKCSFPLVLHDNKSELTPSKKNKQTIVHGREVNKTQSKPHSSLVS